jgi:hypothetical protein
MAIIVKHIPPNKFSDIYLLTEGIDDLLKLNPIVLRTYCIKLRQKLRFDGAQSC